MGKQSPTRKRGRAKVRPVEQVWPNLAENVAVHPIIDDPVSSATHMDNTERLAVAQKRLDDKRRTRVRADEPGGPGTFEPATGNAKFR